MLQKCVFGCISLVTPVELRPPAARDPGMFVPPFPRRQVGISRPRSPTTLVAKHGNYYKHGQLATDSYTQARKNER